MSEAAEDKAAQVEPSKGYIDGFEAGRRAERAHCLELIERCISIYSRHAYGGAEYPAADAPAKVVACEYVKLVVKDWELSPHYRPDRLPMPF